MTSKRVIILVACASAAIGFPGVFAQAQTDPAQTDPAQTDTDAQLGKKIPATVAAPEQPQEQSVEAALVQCIWDKDPDLVLAIRDAASQEAFMAAFKRGLALCAYPETKSYSMGRFFGAVKALAGPPEYED